MTRIPRNHHRAAATIYRAWRRHLGHRQAYWLCVSRYGFPYLAEMAWSFLNPTNRRIAVKP